MKEVRHSVTECHAVSHCRSAVSKLLQGPFDDLVLHTLMQLGEKRAEAGHPDHEVAVILRVLLRVSQLLGIQHVELNVITLVAGKVLTRFITLSRPLRVLS